jgi:glycosyltransferase involved in cell wall biosynthesis
MTLLTIITINYNNAIGLKKTMQSVQRQKSNDFEYIVVNGTTSNFDNQPMPIISSGINLTDIDVIDNMLAENLVIQSGFNSCSWRGLNAEIKGGFYCEPDDGIYAAMNKGICASNGKYIHFLNSGDWLVDEDVVGKMLSEIERMEQPDVLVGNKIMVRSDGKVMKCTNNKNPISVYTFYNGTIEHTSAYIRKNLFEEYGLYDEHLKIVSDWKWYFQAVGLGRAKVAFTDCYVSFFDTTGISSTNRELEMKERRQVLEQLIPSGVLVDYDRYYNYIEQMERLKRYPFIYKIVWFVERCLFKLDKWELKYWKWK